MKSQLLNLIYQNEDDKQIQIPVCSRVKQIQGFYLKSKPIIHTPGPAKGQCDKEQGQVGFGG